MVKYRYEKWIGGMSAALVLSAALSGCLSNPGDTQGELKNYSGPVKVKTLEQTRAEERSAQSVVPITQIHNQGYVPIDAVAKAIGFHGEWLKDGKYGVGDRDAALLFRPGESTVDNGEGSTRMVGPAVKQNGKLYVPVESLQALFGDAASFRSDDHQLSFYPRLEGSDSGADDLALPFKDGQSTAQGGLNAQSAGRGRQPGSDAGNFRSLASSSTGDQIIREAKRYMGVKYDFGAENYSESGTFDCSSYTRYIFAKFGVSLPRTARAQGKLGRSVSRDELQKGDLVFFSVPGRFKSDSTVGHVGIYMGNGEMINANTEPEDGVQITDINKPYWQETFLFAKRVL
ncbi:C40 family peptidase [Cohnella lubricantis]|uniref:C40 family peptidase n=1 Tax=Cohnella lubricantis TaxID=2163172 RepID=A0A841T7Q2_9BACL|nr:C40 family peptidase [Cohnella lubricantis]MBB6677543.1 C40 family peptidase [Cohnella lubricantis]MBP2116571.1 cell wall-associated NlpC family hydrolase [Cohnella lubricantis]